MATAPTLEELEVNPRTIHEGDLIVSTLIRYVRIGRWANEKVE